MTEVETALAWYSEEEYARFQAAADDPEVWCEDYESWKATADSAIATLKTQGMTVVKIPLNLNEFEKWCAENDRSNEASAPSQYAASILRSQDADGA